jgi:hypothetical protein
MFNYNSLDTEQITNFMQEYLPLLARSIKVDYKNDRRENCVAQFCSSKGWGTQGPSWAFRVLTWHRSLDTVFYDIETGKFCRPTEYQLASGKYKQHLPIFRGYAEQALNRLPEAKPAPELGNEDLNIRNKKYIGNSGYFIDAGSITSGTYNIRPPTQENNTMKNTLKSTADTLLNTNKEAVLMATKLSVGKTSNAFVMNKLLGNFPWYAKFFSKKKDFLDNPLAKLAAAQTAAALVAHFASDNKKLAYIAESMVQDAVVQVTYSSDQLESLIMELQDLVKLPDFLNEKF